jgi:ABC-type nickel/cobalt efflux system permease component RcnA
MSSALKMLGLLALVLGTQYSVLSTSAHAHPVPRRIHDRVLTVRLAADAVTVDYHLELDELTAYDELPAVAEPADLAKITRDNFYDTFTRLYAPVLAGNLTAKLDGRPLQFECVRRGAQLKDSVWCDFVFRAPWQPSRQHRHTFQFYEGNYEEEAGQVKVSLAEDHRGLAAFGGSAAALLASPSGQGPFAVASALLSGSADTVSLVEKDEPDESLKNRAPLDLRPGDALRLRKASATFIVAPAEARSAQTTTEAPVESETGAAPAVRSNTLVGLLLDTRQGFLLLLVLAACLGAAHALTPGHGKTLVAAYLVGERGTVWHAILLGVATTLTHTGVVLVLAAALRFAPPAALDPIQGGLGLVGGLAIVAVGFWLLLRRLSGRADHVHLGGHGHHHGGHHHHHDHGHADHYHDEHGHAHPLRSGGDRAGWWSVTVLGISGGIVPCVDAILMLIYAISAGVLWLALPLLLAFSGGLAAVLIVLGILVVSARGLAEARLGGQRRFRQVFRVLPIVSAIVVIAMGLWLCRESLAEPPAPAAHTSSPP